MSVKSIRKNAFENMLEILDNIEKIQQRVSVSDFGDWETKDLRERLPAKHNRYILLISELTDQVEDFDRLYKRVKMQFIPRTLKVMKATVPDQSEDYKLVMESIVKNYRQ